MDKKLVDELRQMFLDGATPSELMHYIARHHEGDPRLHFVLMDFFREAFAIPLLRNVIPSEDYAPNAAHAHYNRDVLPEMVRRIEDWNTANLEDSWLNGLSVRSLSEHVERLKTTRFDELSRVWDDLNDDEKRFIVRKVAQKDHYWEVVNALSALAERLQQKIVELEQQSRWEPPVPRGAGEVAARQTDS